MRAYRHPESVDPGASLIVAELAAAALEELGDDVGVARARYLMCELAWLRGASERGLRDAREALRLARRAGATVELDAGVSVVALALVVNRVPVPTARAECDELLRLVAGRRFAELGVRGFAAVLDAMAGDFEQARTQLARSRDGLNDLGLHQASIWMAVFDAQAELLAGDPARAEAALCDAERVADEIGDRWFHSTILVDRAHVLLAQDSPERAAAAVARIEEVPAPNDLEWRIKRHAARGKLAARKGTPSARWRRPGPRSHWRSRPRCSCSAPMPGATWPRSPIAWAGRRRPPRRGRPRSASTGPRATWPPRISSPRRVTACG